MDENIYNALYLKINCKWCMPAIYRHWQRDEGGSGCGLHSGECLELDVEGEHSFDFCALPQGEPGTCWRPTWQQNVLRP